MQIMDEQKRIKILDVATKLFASQPFHKVLLSDVAEAASVGKGTLYTYFKSKEDLYLSVLYSGFSTLVERLNQRVDQNTYSAIENMEAVICEIVSFAYQNPHLYKLMRTIPGKEAIDLTKWDAKRRELKSLIESVIHQGIIQGVFIDSHPEFTARYIPGLIRSVLIDGTEKIEREALKEHIMYFVMAAIKVRES